MIEFTDKQKFELQRLGVAAVYLFGSRAQGAAGPLSDFDFGVIMSDPRQVEKSTLDAYQKLYDLFSAIIQPESLEADVIDIVFLDSPRVPLELKAHVIRRGSLLYDAFPSRRANLESRILLDFADFAPLRKEMSAALLQRV
ncbi:MAG: hypothetical protein A3C90_04565 [Candidatus Magasanikbacteria bacterium RIFCSPHIGHO2_02_FULL_51_14]|uniref:Polymerase beta nucleotidyltransferase domain-containing protein n=1 Tax=Candidatus Magasanikbacteria bacterium RIFCSPHIGHO2_02_FULL_51_14 TaxID=1798683 RepID=A0A1F6MH98_9BACT|nr:MAG: hypothetical protein A3C90_04565 [Candidatus Magasanikbacteria bacterium RIFCSPHIGHO2_02_FULL_51_14]